MKFSELNLNPDKKTIYMHETCATDTNQVKPALGQFNIIQTFTCLSLLFGEWVLGGQCKQIKKEKKKEIDYTNINFATDDTNNINFKDQKFSTWYKLWDLFAFAWVVDNYPIDR